MQPDRAANPPGSLLSAVANCDKFEFNYIDNYIIYNLELIFYCALEGPRRVWCAIWLQALLFSVTTWVVPQFNGEINFWRPLCAEYVAVIFCEIIRINF